MLTRNILMTILSVGLLTACQQTPLQKLASDIRLDDMNNVYWSKARGEDPKLWLEARQYCKSHQEKPNCAPVVEAQIFLAGSTKVPAYGTSGHTMEIPDFTKNIN